MYNPFEDLAIWIAANAGIPVDQSRMFIIFFLNYAVAAVHRMLPRNRVLRHLYVIVIGGMLSYWWIGFRQIIHTYICALLCYIVITRVQTESMPMYVFVISFAYLLGSHVYRVIYDYGGYTMDASMPLMVLSVRLSHMAYSIYDGKKALLGQELSEFQKRHAIFEIPSLLEYMSFVLYYGSFMVGPFVLYKDYEMFSNGKLVGVGFDAFYFMKRLSAGLLFFVIAAFSASYLPLDFLTTEEFKTMSFPIKLGQLYITTLCARMKYYCSWSLSENASLVNGLSYNGEDSKGNAKFDKLSNVRVIGVEWGKNPYQMASVWNIGIHRWLRECVYVRLTPKGKKAGIFQMIAVYSVSAFWHGLYPGYYVFFLSFALVTASYRCMKPYIPLIIEPLGSFGVALHFISGRLTMILIVMYLAPVFHLLRLEDSLAVFKSLYFYGYIMVAIPIVISVVFPLKREKEKKTEKKSHRE